MGQEEKSIGEPKVLHQEKMKLGNREYTFEFRESARGNRFLNVFDEHERNGKVRKDSLLIFEEHLENFMQGLSRSVEFIHKNPAPPKPIQ